MNLFRRIIAIFVLMLVGLTSVFGFASSGPKIAPGDFFSETPNCARSADGLAQYLCRVNGWLQYDSTSGYVVATNRGRIPWSYGATEALGETDKFGNIIIRPGLTGDLLEETVRHEGVHRFLSPRPTSFLGEARANFGQAAYWNSNFLRYTEEAIAETIGSRNLWQGLKHPFHPGYDISKTGLFLEGAGYTGLLGGSIWLGSEIGNGGE